MEQDTRDPEKVKQYARELCDLINMKPFGDCRMVNFDKEDVAKRPSI
ncbi:MAG: hypothetical protein JRJ02_13395 [Deltaproteobacteria bacterium]|nr:hypothetical protein [Deltaproteobacteria bacterium]